LRNYINIFAVEDQAVESIEHKDPIDSSKPRSICIKQTFHSFKNYKSNSFLHCGVSNSTGKKTRPLPRYLIWCNDVYLGAVYHFDGKGVHVDAKWPESISIPIPGDGVDVVWDRKLEEHYQDEKA
jgi:hypothetical protein